MKDMKKAEAEVKTKPRAKAPEYKSSGKKPKMKKGDSNPTNSRAKTFC